MNKKCRAILNPNIMISSQFLTAISLILIMIAIRLP